MENPNSQLPAGEIPAAFEGFSLGAKGIFWPFLFPRIFQPFSLSQNFPAIFPFPEFSSHFPFPEFSSLMPQFPSLHNPPAPHPGLQKSWKIPNFAQFPFSRQTSQGLLSHRALPGAPAFPAPERFPEKLLLPTALPWKTLLRSGKRRGKRNFWGENGNLGGKT